MKSRILLFTLFMTAIACSDTQTATNVNNEQPNIIVILADDLGYGDLGCYGQQFIETPNIDRMAAEGMRFTQFYAGSTVCAPSRSAFLSGQHTGHTYIRGNREVQPEGQEPLADSVLTIAEVLQAAGYSTGAFGKWGLGFVGSDGDPLHQGFDTFYGYNCQRYAHRYYPPHLWNNDNKVILEGNDLHHTVAYAPDTIHQRALSFIEGHGTSNAGDPFFLFLAYTLPHAELLVPDDSIFRHYRDRFPETPHKGNDYGPAATITGYTSQPYPRATYAAMVSRLDRYVGDVFAKLDEMGIAENTLVVFASDNGPAREGGTDPGFFNSNGGLKGHKRDVYEGGIRIPFIAWWPGTVAANITATHVGAIWDLFPTFAELADANATATVDGISLLPTLLGKDNQQNHNYLYWEFHELGGRQSIRKDDWKAVRNGMKPHANAPLELYNIVDDPGETTDLAERYPEICAQLEHMLMEARTPSHVPEWNF